MQHLSHKKDNKMLEYVVPKGGTIWADTLAIPKGAKNKERVYELLIR